MSDRLAAISLVLFFLLFGGLIGLDLAHAAHVDAGRHFNPTLWSGR